MTIAVLGPGGVGGLLAGALARICQPVVIVAREQTAAAIAAAGLQVRSAMLGDFQVHPATLSRLSEPVSALIIATKSDGLSAAVARVQSRPPLVLPLLNGLDHLAVLRERFGRQAVVAGSIRVESDRALPGLIVQTSSVARVEMASASAGMLAPMGALAAILNRAGVATRVREESSPAAEVEVIWSKLGRLCPLACCTSAHDLTLGEIREDPVLNEELVAAVRETCAVAAAEGAPIDPEAALAELSVMRAAQGSSMRRDLSAGRPPELDAIAGAVLRAGARHGIACPAIAGLSELIAARAGVAPPRP